MYIGSGETEERDNINKIKNYHMTFLEAATLAKHAHVSKLMLTHFNPSLQYPSSHLSDAREIFPETYAASDNLLLNFAFESDLPFDTYLRNSTMVKASITKTNPYADYLCFEDRNTRKVRKNGTKRKKVAQNRYGCRKKKLNNTQTSQ